MQVMKPEKTVKMVLKKKDLDELRASVHVCSCCGEVFVSDDMYQRVCDVCVEKAMVAEGFYGGRDDCTQV